jgi:adenine-specific DNA-methyltransferase
LIPTPFHGRIGKLHGQYLGDLIACFSEKISDRVAKEISSRKPVRAVFRDSSFADSPFRINVEEMFKLLSRRAQNEGNVTCAKEIGKRREA